MSWERDIYTDIVHSSEPSVRPTQRPSAAEVKHQRGLTCTPTYPTSYAAVARAATTIPVPYGVTYCHDSVVRTSFLTDTVPHTHRRGDVCVPAGVWSGVRYWSLLGVAAIWPAISQSRYGGHNSSLVIFQFAVHVD